MPKQCAKNAKTILLTKLRQISGSRYLSVLICLLAGLDAYVLIIPIELLLVTAVLGRRRNWIAIATGVALGSATGATTLALLANTYGKPWIEEHLPQIIHSKAWLQSFHFLESKDAFVGIFLVAISPFPQQAAVALAGLARTPLISIFLSVFLGRLVKYAVVARSAIVISHS